jgi:hypothetical protein
MNKTITHGIFILAAAAIFAAGLSPSFAAKIRFMNETDAGGDPDDEASLVRFLLYTNEWDIEGIFGTRSESKKLITDRIDAYGACYDKLKQHKPDFPTPTFLKSVTFSSRDGTKARDHIIKMVDKDDPRPVYYCNWGCNDGSQTAMDQALDYVKSKRSEDEYKKFVGKLFFTRDGDRHIGDHAAHLNFWADFRNPNRWYWRFRPLTEKAGGFDINRDVKTNHGPLGPLYTTTKEGDSPGFIFVIPVGIADPHHPNWGSWGGRCGPRDDKWKGPQYWWMNAEDTYEGTTSRDNTLKRWAVHLQNDFRARMDWCVNDKSGANHEPVPKLNNTGNSSHITMKGNAGATVSLSAQGSSDPDGDNLSYEWVYYPEPGTYSGTVTVDNNKSQDASVKVPDDFGKDDTIHIVLIVTDDGEPALTRYHRALIVGGEVAASRRADNVRQPASRVNVSVDKSSRVLHISALPQEGRVRISLIDPVGRIIAGKTCSGGGSARVAVPDHASGIYILEVKSENCDMKRIIRLY